MLGLLTLAALMLCSTVLGNTYHFTVNFLSEFPNGISCRKVSIYAVQSGDLEDNHRQLIFQSRREIGGVYQFIWRNPPVPGETAIEVECEQAWRMQKEDYDRAVRSWHSMSSASKRELIECQFGTNGEKLTEFMAEWQKDELKSLKGMNAAQIVKVFDDYLSSSRDRLIHKNRKIILVTKPFVIKKNLDENAKESVTFLDVTSSEEADAMKNKCVDYALEPGTMIKYGADGLPYPENFYSKTGWPSYRDRNYFMKVFSEVDAYMRMKCLYNSGFHEEISFQPRVAHEIKIKAINTKFNTPEVEMAAALKFLSKIENTAPTQERSLEVAAQPITERTVVYASYEGQFGRSRFSLCSCKTFVRLLGLATLLAVAAFFLKNHTVRSMRNH
ncbi:hypothetical protein MP638_000835 [Amoeboaphelidium occidentale]|nr:hypothetical protein MP638_000835 [Amoeboaphelidium occidentale]